MMRLALLLSVLLASIVTDTVAFLGPVSTTRSRSRTTSSQTSASIATTDDVTVEDNDDDDETPVDDQHTVLLQSSILGNVHKIQMPGQDDTFVGKLGVPTFASIRSQPIRPEEMLVDTQHRRSRGLEGALQQGPAFMLDDVISPAVCEQLIQECTTQLGFGKFNQGKNNHGALQILVSQDIADVVGQALGQHVDMVQVMERYNEMSEATVQNNTDTVRLVYSGLNRRWRIYSYEPSGDETFAPHIDAGFPPSDISEDGTELIWDATLTNEDGKVEVDIVSRLTVLMYLNDDFVGGETKFYGPAEGPQGGRLIASVRPVTGSLLVFPQGVGMDAMDYARSYWPSHEGSAVISGRSKYVIRSDILVTTQKEPKVAEDETELFQHDLVVRNTFLPPGGSMNDQVFQSHIADLYNPHMGVENVGPLLHSLIRFTKKRRIVEIGGGYTSMWILRALKENDEELARIRDLQRTDECKLLNIDWTVAPVLDRFDSQPAGLLCVDNCVHEKETATGVYQTAKSLGLDSYINFRMADAFEMDLADSTIDMLWCDFGVGDRMRDFMVSTWSSIRPGGFLICHSTLTNRNTRDWLEAMRSGQDESITGVPSDEYTEISLLEPHKRFQNSVSIFHKRKSGKHQDEYSEPIFSKYA